MSGLWVSYSLVSIHPVNRTPGEEWSETEEEAKGDDIDEGEEKGVWPRGE